MQVLWISHTDCHDTVNQSSYVKAALMIIMSQLDLLAHLCSKRVKYKWPNNTQYCQFVTLIVHDEEK